MPLLYHQPRYHGHLLHITTRGIWRVVCRTCSLDEGTGLWAEFSSSGERQQGMPCVQRKDSHLVGEPGATLARIRQEGRSQLCDDLSQEGPLVNQNENKDLNQFSHQVVVTSSELMTQRGSFQRVTHMNFYFNRRN